MALVQRTVLSIVFSFSASRMPHHSNCCVPGCTNNFRNAPNLQYHRIPKDQGLRKIYKVILKNETLKLDSDLTRVCSAHFEGGTKLSRMHLPSIFPWSVEKPKRKEINRIPAEDVSEAKKRKADVSSNASGSSGLDIDQNNVEAVIEMEDTCKPTEKASETELTSEEQNEILQGEIDIDQNNVEAVMTTIIQMEDKPAEKACETELTSEEQSEILILKLKGEIELLKEENNNLKKEVTRLNNSLDNHRFDIDKYKNSNEDITFFTGFPDYNAMVLCYRIIEESSKNLSYGHERVYVDMGGTTCRQPGRPRVLNSFQEFTLVMMRLRLGLFERDLARRFSVSVPTVSRITTTWLRFLRLEFEPLISIPPGDVIRLHMPEIYKKVYPKLTVIVDCTEVEMEKPSSLDAQSVCYSSYKSKTTMKALLGITPSGVLCFVSDFFPGSTSDKEITVQSGFLSKLNHGDQIMADKGFNCQDELASVGATLVIPAFLRGIKQFSKEQTEHNKKVATLRIHVERLMERIKNWHIFDHRIPISLAPVASDILIVVSALSNFHPPLIN